MAMRRLVLTSWDTEEDPFAEAQGAGAAESDESTFEEKTDLASAPQAHGRPAQLDFSKIAPLADRKVHNFPPSASTPSDAAPPERKKPAITPTIALLFSLTSRASTFAIVIPATVLSVVAGLIPPYMTQVIGVAFEAFTTYSVISAQSPSALVLAQARSELLRSTRNSSIQFAGLAGLVLIASTASIGLWVINGERVARALRREVFMGVSARSLAWFDTGMGAGEKQDTPVGEDSESGQGVGGLMGRFARETEDVRTATSQTIGLILQYITSFVVCLGLSFYRNALLTVVVLSSIPAIVAIVGITERLAQPLAEIDRDFAAKSAGRVDRVLGAVPTIKAFNAEAKETTAFNVLNGKAFQAYCKLHFVWGVRTGGSQFLLLSMFVQGFWFGSYLVKAGRSTPAAVTTSFWACLLASTYLQLCVPMLVALEKGKIGMADMLELARVVPVVDNRSPFEDPAVAPGSAQLAASKEWRASMRHVAQDPFAAQDGNTHYAMPGIHEESESPGSYDLTFNSPPVTPMFIPLKDIQLTAVKRGRGVKPRLLKKIRPATFTGELSLKNVTFHYPSCPHPAAPALSNVSLYFAAQETTYVVGGSGSGKSTVGNLLLGLYAPELGQIEVDEQALEWLDEEWLRGHVGCVSQGASVIFDGTVHDNIAIGVVGQIRSDGTRRDPKDVTRDEVVEACRSALVHEFVRDLPEGYDTFLSGEKGASLSGGQRQRLAIARAWLRDPTVLILDEVTSALDATSRHLVSEAVKLWRRNKTTIIITHDLTPIDADDFVYVMTDGKVVESGFRRDLEQIVDGEFNFLAGTQHEPESPAHDAFEFDDDEDAKDLEFDLPEELYYHPDLSRRSQAMPSISVTPSSNFAGFGLFDTSGSLLASQGRELAQARRASARFSTQRGSRQSTDFGYPARTVSCHEPMPALEYDYASHAPSDKRGSTSSFMALETAAMSASSRRPGGKRIKHKTMVEGGEIATEWSSFQRQQGQFGGDHTVVQVGVKTQVQMSLVQLARKIWPTLPNKPLFLVGLLFSITVGACTPVFSSLLAKLMSNLGNPNAGGIVITTSLLILLMAFVDGMGTFLKFYCLERAAMGWIVSIRARMLTLVLAQDKSFFDDPANSTSSLTNLIVKDADDARTLVGTVVGGMIVVISMIFIGLTWAFSVGWELTLVGLGLAPVFVLATRAQGGVIAKFEAKNKIMRDDISKKFHQVASNIRAIRAMSIETVFVEKFDESIDVAYVSGVKTAPFAGFGFGMGAALTYIAESLMFYVGALLVVNGRYSFGQMLEVFTLIIFSVTFSSQIMAYLPQMAKSVRAATDLCRLLDLSSDTQESQGRMTFPISGRIVFDNVVFSYPSRPDVPILKGVSFDVRPGECIGIVGASGSGKSTIAALLQRLYEPSFGDILLDGRPLSRTDVHYLRDHIAVVSQHPALFDMTVSENIAYGASTDIAQADIEHAAQLAQVHDFIMTLPKGYATMLGENASLISGGQAQRLQIARALVRHREILILDECTSALDATNQAAVMETIMQAKIGRTTVIVTHKLAVMEKCDRLLVVVDGRLVEQGTVEELRAIVGGQFATMASGGEWSGN